MSQNEKQDVAAALVARVQERYTRYLEKTYVRGDRIFSVLLLVQWVAAILVAIWLSPYAWEGRVSTVHMHVLIAIFGGGIIVSLPIFATLKWTGAVGTRISVAVAQMLISAMLIHLTGGRIETHFHVFVSLAALAFYLDWKVLVVASVTVALEHFLRGMYWPESVYGITNPEWWRFLEHGLWVVLCAAALIYLGYRAKKAWLEAAEEIGMLEAMTLGKWRSVLDSRPGLDGAE